MKVFKNLSTYILALGFSATLFSGCEDYLNVSDDLAAEMTMEEVFNNTSVWDHIKMWDPEQGNSNGGFPYPLNRTFTFGLDFTF